jgi:hypothetical protein
MKGLFIYLFVVVMIVALYGFAYSSDFSHNPESKKNSEIQKLNNIEFVVNK